MKTMFVTDKFNAHKVWVITRTKCYHYYMQQKVKGRVIGKRVRTTKAHLISVGVI